MATVYELMGRTGSIQFVKDMIFGWSVNLGQGWQILALDQGDPEEIRPLMRASRSTPLIPDELYEHLSAMLHASEQRIKLEQETSVRAAEASVRAVEAAVAETAALKVREAEREVLHKRASLERLAVYHLRKLEERYKYAGLETENSRKVKKFISTIHDHMYEFVWNEWTAGEDFHTEHTSPVRLVHPVTAELLEIAEDFLPFATAAK